MDLDIKVRHGAGIHKAKVEVCVCCCMLSYLNASPAASPDVGDVAWMCPQFTEAGRAKVVLEDRDSGLAAGQFAAFYKGDECLGAGSISDSTFLPDQV